MIGYNKVTVAGYVASDISETKSEYLFSIRIPYLLKNRYSQRYIKCSLNKSYFKNNKTLILKKGDSVIIDGALNDIGVHVYFFILINKKAENSMVLSMRRTKNPGNDLDEQIEF